LKAAWWKHHAVSSCYATVSTLDLAKIDNRGVMGPRSALAHYFIRERDSHKSSAKFPSWIKLLANCPSSAIYR